MLRNGEINPNVRVFIIKQYGKGIIIINYIMRV